MDVTRPLHVVLIDAAREIKLSAEALKQCATIGGKWDDSSGCDEQEYQREISLVNELVAHHIKEAIRTTEVVKLVKKYCKDCKIIREHVLQEIKACPVCHSLEIENV